MIWSADNFRPFRLALIPRGFLLLFIGGGFLFVALAIARKIVPLPQAETTNTHLIGERLRLHSYICTLVGLLMFALLILINANPPVIPPAQVSIHLQFLLFGIGLLLFAFGISGVKRPQTVNLLTFYRSNRAEIWIIVFITLLNLALGMWQLDTGVHTLIDETHTVRAVNQLAMRSDIGLFMPYSGSAFFPWLYPYLQLGPLVIFGHTFAAIRMVGVILGALTIPGLYILAKNLFDRQTALIAALFFATFPPHIHLNRLSLINAVDPFLGTWAFAFLALGLKSSKRLHFILAGVCLGLTQYFYEGGKLLFPALAASWFVFMLVFHRKPILICGFRLTLMTALFISVPLYITWASWNLPFISRLTEVGSQQLDWATILAFKDGGVALRGYLEQNLLPTFLHIIQRVDTSQFYYGGETALILGYLLPVFFLGIFHILWRWRTSAVLLLLWLALTVLGNSLINPQQNTWSARYMVVLPALALLMAVGIRYTVHLLFWGVFQNRDKLSSSVNIVLQLAYKFVWILIVGLALLQPMYYFGYHLPFYNKQIRIDSLDYIDLIYRVRLLPLTTSVIAVTDRAIEPAIDHELRLFWNFDTPVMRVMPSEFTVVYLSQLPPGAYAFFMDPQNTASPELLYNHFSGISGPLWSPYNVPVENQYMLYYVAIQ
jgi:4-amino-4-deoxy-L-arabinose transferase-like glycosyltransferase